MKRVCLFIFLLLACLQVQAQREIIDKVIGKIGGEFVMLSEVEEEAALMKARTGILAEGARCNIMEQLMANKLLINQAKLDSVEVGDEEVEGQLSARIERILSFMNGDLKQFEAYYGQTVNEVKEQFREDLSNQLLIERMRGQIMSNVNVTPGEVRAFYNQIPTDSLPYFSSEVEIREIVYKPVVNKEERQKSIDKLEDIRAGVVSGEVTFEEMAEKFSDDGSARVGGDLGWATRGKYVPEFEAAAYKLDQNEISEVVETQFGFHIIQMLGRRGNSIHVRHILVRPEITYDDLELARKHLDSVRLLVMNDSLSFSEAVKRFSDEDEQSYNNDGRMVNPVTGNTFFEVGDLDPDIYFTIDTMDIGGISKAFEFRGQSGEVMYRIVELQSRTSPHTANLQQDYSKIRQAAIDSKRNEFINEWLEERIQHTYVDFDVMYDGCPNLTRWKEKESRP